MNKTMRTGFVLAGAVSLLMAFAFFLQMPWTAWVWPIKSSPLSNIFISSILAAIAAPTLWIGLAGEARALAGGAINLLVTSAGFAGSMFIFFSRSPQPQLLIFAAGAILTAGLCIGLIFYSQPKPFLDRRPVPNLVRGSFILFVISLLLAASLLLIKFPNTFPWAISAENSVMYGWIFLGNMTYFIYALIFPAWSNARGQLLAFLAYDLVLIVPFLLHFQDVKPEMLPSLVIFTSVISYSGLLSAYFLFVHPATRFSSAHKVRITQDKYEEISPN
jgi:hypothetical protein